MSNEFVIKTAYPSDLFKDKVAIITGGSRGIGRAAAIRFAESGAHIVINYARREDDAVELANLIRALGREALLIQADVSKLAEATLLVKKTVEHFGRCDILVANAGIWEGDAVENMSEELWDKVLDINLKGTWTVCRAAVGEMKKQGSGSIVIVSSTAGQRGEAGYSNYAASKGGQISFTKALSTELAPTIRVNSVAPGWVDTEMSDSSLNDSEEFKKIVEAIPMKRVASADDIALSILFLASDLSRHITGEVLNVNGGSVLCG